MSTEKTELAEDLELTGEEADRVKGGVLPIEGGGGGGSSAKLKKKKKKSQKIGPYQGKH